MLLQLVDLGSNVSGTPLFAEVGVHRDSAPYLVASNKGFLWIEEAFKGDVVRSATLRPPWEDHADRISLEIVRAVRTRGLQSEWGNVFANTPKGYQAAEAYLRSYDLDQFELLDHDEKNPWIPEGSSVLVPVDRSYVGILGFFTDKSYIVVVHNPSRGIAVLGPW